MKKILNSIKNIFRHKNNSEYDMCKNMDGEFKEYCSIQSMKHII